MGHRRALAAAFSLVWFGSAATSAQAGPNSNGALIVALDPDHAYSSDVDAYCGTSALTACEDAIVQVDQDGPVVLHILAAFSEGSTPRLGGVLFGIEFDTKPGFTVGGAGHCGDYIIENVGWPASGSSAGILWSPAETGIMTEVCWFGLYAYASYGTGTFRLGPPENEDGLFTDDGTPPVVDEIEYYGSIGFFGAAGELPCPGPPPVWACCDDGLCQITTEEECADERGDWMEGELCDPTPCPVAIGACCHHEACSVTDEQTCWAGGGWFLGDVECDPNYCIEPATFDMSWGRVKSKGLRESP